MNTNPTDQAVSRLPLESARAELLEEIVGAAAPPAERPSRRRWVAPAAAAAAIAALAVGTAVYRDGSGGSLNGFATDSPASEKDQRVDVTAAGWQVSSPGPFGGIYRNGKQTLEITIGPAKTYNYYAQDREDIVSPPAPGMPLTVLGASAQMWAYSDPDDFTTIRQVVDGQWMELRGQHLDEAAYHLVLDSLRLVSVAEFEQSMPARFITAAERPAAIDTALEGISDATAMVTGAVNSAGQALPEGSTLTPTSQAEDPYQLGVDIAGPYACAWLADYVSASTAGDAAEAAVAVGVMRTSRQWPVLQQIDPEGDYPEVLWDYADEIAAGTNPDGYQSGLGCR